MVESAYKGTFTLKTILLFTSIVVLIMSGGGATVSYHGWLYTWLSVLTGLVLVELFLSLFRSAIRLVHTVQILEFMWQSMAFSEIYMLHMNSSMTNDVLLYGCTAIVGFFGISTLALFGFLLSRKA